jgi:hypothetical protein
VRSETAIGRPSVLWGALEAPERPTTSPLALIVESVVRSARQFNASTRGTLECWGEPSTAMLVWLYEPENPT